VTSIIGVISSLESSRASLFSSCFMSASDGVRERALFAGGPFRSAGTGEYPDPGTV
jgi:hypothetical protein